MNARKILKESEPSWTKGPIEPGKLDVVHFTLPIELKSIRRRGLVPSTEGNLGPGTYFWLYKPPLTLADVPKGEIALRIKPSKLALTVNLDEVYLRDYGCEIVLDKVSPKRLELLTKSGWIPL